MTVQQGQKNLGPNTLELPYWSWTKSFLFWKFVITMKTLIQLGSRRNMYQPSTFVLQITNSVETVITIRKSISWWNWKLEVDRLQGWFNTVAYTPFRALMLFVHNSFHLSSSVSQQDIASSSWGYMHLMLTSRGWGGVQWDGEGSCASTIEQRNWVSFWLEQF